MVSPLFATQNRPQFDVEGEVKRRYAAGAHAAEAALCCPVTYDPRRLALLPAEILERDYGCGDPSVHVGPGETVLDLGSGGGKICYLLAQVVGPAGRVIGVDMNDDMLALARRHEADMAARIGHHVTDFRKGRIQDLALDLDKVQAFLDRSPVRDLADWSAFEAECDRLRRDEPLVADAGVDVVVSNCVLNLVRPGEKKQLFAEIFRVLRRGGRAVISDIVCDEPVPAALLADPALWSGCVSGAFQEAEFLDMFEAAGFYGVEILARQSEPWQTIDGVEFRSMTVRAFKGKDGPCFEHDQAVVYKGPWKQVRDDDGHTLPRGRRIAVCKKTFDLMTDPAGPYAAHVEAIEPRTPVAAADAKPFDCRGTTERDPRQTKGHDYRATTAAGNDCCGEGGCC